MTRPERVYVDLKDSLCDALKVALYLHPVFLLTVPFSFTVTW